MKDKWMRWTRAWMSGLRLQYWRLMYRLRKGWWIRINGWKEDEMRLVLCSWWYSTPGGTLAVAVARSLWLDTAVSCPDHAGGDQLNNAARFIEASLIVPDFTISLFGSSCNYRFFAAICLLFIFFLFNCILVRRLLRPWNKSKEVFIF